MEEKLFWAKKLVSYKKVLVQLSRFVETKELNQMEQLGLVKVFDNTFHLAINLLKSFYEFQGCVNINDSKDAIRLAFKRNLIVDGQTWMDMINSRIKTTYF